MLEIIRSLTISNHRHSLQSLHAGRAWYKKTTAAVSHDKGKKEREIKKKYNSKKNKEEKKDNGKKIKYIKNNNL